VFVHVITQKGKGYALTENDGEKGHAVSAPAAPVAAGAPPPAPKYQDVFAKTLIELAADDDRILAITAAMPTGTSLNKFAAVYPERFFDVGIAEQHAVTFAAGLATQGMRPVAAIYSTFLQRAYDQIIHDVALQKLPVIFCLDRAGFAGDDGRTHHGIYDLSYLRCIPGMTIMAPKDENELRHMMKTAFAIEGGPIAIRYPRGAGVGVPMDEPMHVLPVGRAETLREGDDVAILAAGTMVLPAERAGDLLAAEGVNATVVNMRFVKPLDEELVLDVARRCGAIVTAEENVAPGGFGAAVLELLARHDITIPVKTLAIPDRIFEQASQGRLREMAGLTPGNIAATAHSVISRRQPVAAVSDEAETTPIEA
jgi:1-deoxy-D-xylulose-5-phosphate synthase